MRERGARVSSPGATISEPSSCKGAKIGRKKSSIPRFSLYYYYSEIFAAREETDAPVFSPVSQIVSFSGQFCGYELFCRPQDNTVSRWVPCSRASREHVPAPGIMLIRARCLIATYPRSLSMLTQSREHGTQPINLTHPSHITHKTRRSVNEAEGKLSEWGCFLRSRASKPARHCAS